MGTDQDTLATIRGVFRKDLDSVGMVPTGIGIQMIAQDDAALGFGLLCEAVYVHLYHDRSREDLLAYLSGPLRVEAEPMRHYILKTVLHVRAVLVQHGGDHQKAYQQIMRDKGAEKEVVQKVIEACVRTAKEFKIPWNKTYAFAEPETATSAGSIFGRLIMGAIVTAILIGLYRLLRWLLS